MARRSQKQYSCKGQMYCQIHRVREVESDFIAIIPLRCPSCKYGNGTTIAVYDTQLVETRRCPGNRGKYAKLTPHGRSPATAIGVPWGGWGGEGGLHHPPCTPPKSEKQSTPNPVFWSKPNMIRSCSILHLKTSAANTAPNGRKTAQNASK